MTEDAASILATFKSTIRSPYTSVGSYTIALYFADGERVCAPCAKEDWREICGDTMEGYGSHQAGFVGVYWEGPAQHCVGCNKPQDSEYGDPDAPCEV